MSLPHSKQRLSTQAYLDLERTSPERREYLDGDVYLMAGESPEHGAICTNLVAELRTRLKGGPCQVFSKDMKVRSGPFPIKPQSYRGLFSYPDVVVVCGELRFLDEHRDVIINPAVIIEVLSPNTEAFDRGEKFWRYRTFNSSLTDYLVVAQQQPSIEHFTRQADGRWVIAGSVHDISGVITISSIDCFLKVTEVYDRLSFQVEFEE